MILVTGATGNVGSAIVNELIDSDTPLRIFVRSPSKAADYYDLNKLDVAIGDFSDVGSFERALGGVSAVYLVTNETDEFLAVLPELLVAIRNSDVQRIVVLSALADIESKSFFIRRHGEIDKVIQSFDISATILHPDWFMQNFSGFIQSGAIVFPGGTGKTSFVDVRDVAEVAIECLQNGEHVGRIYRPTGPQALSFANLSELISEKLGENVPYEDLAPDIFTQYLLGSGMEQWRAEMQAGMTFGLRAGVVSPPSNDVEFVTGKSPRLFSDYIDDVLTAGS